MRMRRVGGADLEGKWSLACDEVEMPVRRVVGLGKGAVRRQTQDTGPWSGLEMSPVESPAHSSDNRLFRPSGLGASLVFTEHLLCAGPSRSACRLTVQTGSRDTAEDTES